MTCLFLLGFNILVVSLSDIRVLLQQMSTLNHNCIDACHTHHTLTHLHFFVISFFTILTGITTSPTNSEPFGGELMCWGFNQKGQAKPPAGTFIQVSCGMFHSCALSIDEKIKCWGAQGIGSSPEGEFLQVSCGNFHTCAILKDGHLKCWGKNYDNQVTDAPTGGGFVQVSSGKTHNCAIKNDGSLHCWGSNNRGESQHPEGYQFLQVSASQWHHTCGVTVDHQLLCWGADGFGQCSDVPEGMQFSMVSTGRKYSCGIYANGTSSCWGQKIKNYGLDQPPGNHTWTQLSAGYMHNCGITNEGDALCWGQDTGGQSTVPSKFFLKCVVLCVCFCILYNYVLVSVVFLAHCFVCLLFVRQVHLMLPYK